MKNFIICLSKIESSLETAQRLKTQLEGYGADVELFEGTYGTDAKRMMEEEGRTLHPWGIKGPPKDGIIIEQDPNLHWGPGIQGCFYSHYRLWQKCVELNEPITIWEDDIVLSRPYMPVEWTDVLVLALGHPGKTDKYRHYLDNPSGTPIAADYYQSSMPGNCGYAIKPHAAKKLVDTYAKTYLAADNAINQHHVIIQVHSYVMGIALTKADGKRSLTNAKSFWSSWSAGDEKINTEYSCYVISNKPDLFQPIQNSISPQFVEFYDGTGMASFSKLVNSCAAKCPTEIVLMMSDKVMPTSEDVKKAIVLLEKGYGFVALYRFAFFAFRKELFRKIGPMDERFVGGGYEDDDFYIRMKEANIAMYVTEEVAYTKSGSSWDYSESVKHFINKWIPNFNPDVKLHHNEIERRIPEMLHPYEFGPSVPTTFLDWSHTYSPPSKARKYTKILKDNS